MTTMTKEQKEAKMAILLERLSELFEGDDSVPKMKDKLKLLTTEFGEFKKVDTKNLLAEVDKIKAGQEKLIKQIRYSKNGLYVPGAEDVEFSVLKAMLGVKTGDWTNAGQEKELMDQWREKASHNAGTGASGAYFIADQVIPDVIAAIYTKSVMISLVGEGTTRVSVLEGLTGGNIKIPKFDGGLIAYWIGEEDEYAESQTKVGDVTLNPKKLGILVRITDSMKKLQTFGFENLLRRDMERAAAKKLDWTIMYGTGSSNMPRGIMNMPGIKFYDANAKTTVSGRAAADAITWVAAAMDFDGLDNMQLALEEDDISIEESYATISAPRFFKKLKQLKTENYTGQTTGLPYLLGMPMLTDAKLTDVIGDWDASNQIPNNNLPGESINGTTAATSPTGDLNTDVFAGNLSEVVLGRWAGIEIEDDGGKGKGFTSDHTYMKLRLYADVGARQERALVVCPNAKVR